MALLIRVAEHQVAVSIDFLESHLQREMKEMRQQLASSYKSFLSPAALASGSGSGSGSGADASHQLLSELLSRLEQSTVHNLKTALANLLQFTAYDVTFASKARFLVAFGKMVREQLVVCFFEQIASMGREFCEGRGDKAYVNATLILVLSKFAKNLEASTAGYILDLCEQQFRLGSVGDENDRKLAH
ncbi:MAG: hypothetical protein GY854_07470, partial [Deltaproteobacteria bacterium]|nr:hypothetical protein [Deltaproteobacteria bacterium]